MMHHRYFYWVWIFFAIGVVGCNATQRQNGTKSISHINTEIRSIFNGQNLDGWDGDQRFWRVENGMIIGEVTDQNVAELKQNTFLIWKGGKPANFELIATYRISKEGNSGIQYRSEMVDGIPYAMKGYQIDIDGANQYTGQNYEERARAIIAYPGQRVTMPKVKGTLQDHVINNAWSATIIDQVIEQRDSVRALIHDSWNTIKVIAKNNHLQHYINGTLVCDITDDDVANRKLSGLIGLQLHAGHVMQVAFKDIQLKEIE